MADNSKIEWTDHTFNPWEGCQKIGPGCDHCYAETRNARFNGAAINWGPGAPRRRTSAANWHKPLKWNREDAAFAEKYGRKQRVFSPSLADPFDNEVDPKWRADFFDLIDATPNLDWLLLTKRIGNVTPMLKAMGRECLPVHVWLGATIVNQEEADRDIPKLLSTPAVVRFLSCEPLLGPLDWIAPVARWQQQTPIAGKTHIPWWHPLIDWIIAGGESGPGARPMHPEWARSLRDQCAAAGVAFHFKQWGEWLPDFEMATNRPQDDAEQSRFATCVWDTEADAFAKTNGSWCDSDQWYFARSYNDPEQSMTRIGKKRAGRLLDGVEHNGFPA
mgnify:CR=1 FL=1